MQNRLTTTQRRNPRTAQAYFSTVSLVFQLPGPLQVATQACSSLVSSPAPASETQTWMGQVGLEYPPSEYCYARNAREVLRAGGANGKSPLSLLAWHRMAR